MFTWCMMVIPIITMRGMSEDRKNKTESGAFDGAGQRNCDCDGQISGFLRSLCDHPDRQPDSLHHNDLHCRSALGRYFWKLPCFGLLYGAAMIAIGVFISSLTVSQIIAAIGTFAVAIFLMIIDSLGGATGQCVPVQGRDLDLLLIPGLLPVHARPVQHFQCSVLFECGGDLYFPYGPQTRKQKEWSSGRIKHV